MAIITTSSGSIEIQNGEQFDTIPKGQFKCGVVGDSVIVKLINTDIVFAFGLTTTVDGQSFTTLIDLAKKLGSFSKGGGDGDGVAWQDIDGIPVLIAGLPEGLGSNGQVLKSTGTSVTWQADANTTYTVITQAEADAGTATTGRVISAKVLADTINKLADAKIAALADYGTNDTFDLTTTDADINAAFPSAPIGASIISNTNKVKFFKRTATSWDRWSIG